METAKDQGGGESVSGGGLRFTYITLLNTGPFDMKVPVKVPNEIMLSLPARLFLVHRPYLGVYSAVPSGAIAATPLFGLI
jgi:hypothetical protein